MSVSEKKSVVSPENRSCHSSGKLIRVGVVIPNYGLVGGAEGCVFELTERLGKRPDLDIHVFANRWEQGCAAITFHKIPIVPFPRWFRPISFAWFAQRAVEKAQCDIIHSHDRIFEMDLFTFHGIPHATWIKMVRKKHMSLFDRATSWVERRGITSSRLKYVMPVSGLVKEHLQRVYPVADRKIHVLHPGIDRKNCEQAHPDLCRSDIRKRYGLSERDIVVLFVGMNFEIKNLATVIKGLSKAIGQERSSTPYKLLVVGKGKKDPYVTLARHLGIGERIIFTGVQRDVYRYYQASDIFAMPSLFDTFGLVVTEAMSAGLPVIVTESVGARDLVESGANGFVLSKNPSSREIGDAFIRLMDTEVRMEMGARGKKVAEGHDWDKKAAEIIKTYEVIACRR